MTWWLASGIAVLAGAWFVLVAPRRLRVREVEVPIPDLPPAFDGYRIGVLSDLHQAVLPGQSHTRRAIREVEARDPDLLVLLGDYGVSFKYSQPLSARLYVPEMRAMAPMLRDLRARDGVVALLGNHDYYYDGARVAEWLLATGVTVLVNEHIVVCRGDAALVIAGVDDDYEGSADVRLAFDGAPDDAPRILLAHNPDSVLRVPPGDAPDLVLAGHTHGGQVAFPFYGAPVRFCRIATRKHACGWIPNAVAPLYVSAGVGSQFPIRVGTIPDVVIVTLRRGTRADALSSRS